MKKILLLLPAVLLLAAGCNSQTAIVQNPPSQQTTNTASTNNQAQQTQTQVQNPTPTTPSSKTQTYTNTKYSYQITVPETWQTMNSDMDNVIFVTPEIKANSAKNNADYYSFILIARPENKEIPRGTYLEKKTVGGIQWNIYSNGDIEGQVYNYFTTINGVSYELIAHKPDKSLLDQVVASFKLIK